MKLVEIVAPPLKEYHNFVIAMPDYLKTIQRYIEKNKPFADFKLIPADPNLQIAIIIPSYNELKIVEAIQSIQHCNVDNIKVEILVILNQSTSDSDALFDFHLKQKQLIESHFLLQHIPVHVIGPVRFEEKHAGVGLARKTAMDLALQRFLDIGNAEGILLNFDADCHCQEDYLQKIATYFHSKESKKALSIGFKHRYDGLDTDTIRAIQLYEQHLNYYIQVQKEFNYPYAFQTLGSCFAVKAYAYAEQGGMNKRKAGEDFYFLHKFSAVGELGELDEVLVFPSGRSSDRVPFGTGKAVADILSHHRKEETYNFYAIQSFCNLVNEIPNWHNRELKEILNMIKQSEDMLFEFICLSGIDMDISRIIKNTAHSKNFIHKCQQVFNPFILMKWLHFAEASRYPKMPINEAVLLLDSKMKNLESQI